MKAKILSFSSFSGLVLSGVLSLVPSAWPDHKVGEPQLEELPIWSVCCKDHDCVAEEVKMIGQPSDEMILVDIEGVQTAVNKQKFSPVLQLIPGFAMSIPTVVLVTTISDVSCIPNRAGSLEGHKKTRR